MNDLPRQKLCELIATYGRSLCDDPRRCGALLRDYLRGQYRREVYVLIGALKEGVAADLLASQRVPHEVLLAHLTKRLHDNLALAEDAARWAVESWALALGVISSSECQTSKPEPKSPPPVPPQYRQDNIFPPKPPTPSPVVPTPRGSTQPQPIKYASFWQRFVAALIDGIILIIFYFVILVILFMASTGSSGEVLGSIAILLWFVLNWLYCAFMESSDKQGTFGKMALGIIVADLNNNRISFIKATVRHLGKFISLSVIGYLMVVFTEQKQAFHDMMAGCLVVNKR